MNKNTFVLVTMVLSVVGMAAWAAEKVVQRYECPICHRVAEYAEDSAKIHHCAGSDDKPHTKVVMIHRGKKG